MSVGKRWGATHNADRTSIAPSRPARLGGVQLRKAATAVLPQGIVDRERNRRMLKRLGAATRHPAAASLAVESRLNLLPPGALAVIRTVVDVGANEGRWSLAVLQLTKPRRLIAIEPSPRVVSRLHTALAPYSNAAVVEAAVGATPGNTTLNVTAHSHSASVLPPRTREMHEIYGSGYDVVEEVNVRMTTVDEVTADLDEVSLLKIDVQGFESSVLEGAKDALAKTRWTLIEVNFASHYEGDLLFPDLHELVTGAGFRLTGMSPPSIVGGMAMWADALYENRSGPRR